MATPTTRSPNHTTTTSSARGITTRPRRQLKSFFGRGPFDMASNVPLPYKPTEEEATLYYRGLPSCPRLVARSSGSQWTHPHPYEFAPQNFKTLSPAGQHPIVDLWNDASGPLRRGIIQCLEGIDWNAIDILRVGYQPDLYFPEELPKPQPITLLVSVEPDSTTWEQGCAAALECKAVLEQHGIDDIHCEVRESRVSPAADSPASAPVDAPKLSSSDDCFLPNERDGDSVRLKAELFDILGVAISSFDSLDEDGTKGLYLRQSGEEADQSTFALTCRHVVFRQKDDNGIKYEHDPSMPTLAMVQPTDTRLASSIAEIQDSVRDAKRYIQGIYASRKMSDEEKGDALPRQEAALTSRQSLLQHLEDLRDPEQRIFGHVALAAEYNANDPSEEISQTHWWRDWAMIKLHQGKHQDPLDMLRNKVFIGSQWNQLHSKALHEAPAFTENPSAGDRTVLLQGVIPEEEMCHPPKTNDAHDPVIMVAKYGRGSGLTVGFANALKSVRREVKDGEYWESEEWCIVGCQDGDASSGERMVFSKRGDSGAAVWDMKGRVGGILTSGNGIRGHDVTYVTPMERLLKDIRKFAPGIDLA